MIYISKQLDKWMADRSLDPELAARLGWRSDERDGNGRTVAMPYVLRDQVVNHKYRLTDPKRFHQDPEAVKCMWNGDVIGKGKAPLVITEGELDGLACIQVGFEKTTSVPDGAPAKPVQEAGSSKYDFLKPHMDDLRKETRIILAVDADTAGGNLLKDLTQRLGEAKCWFVRWPVGCKDANEVLHEWGSEVLRRCINEARPCEIEDVMLLSDIPEMVDPEVLSTGMPGLDRHWNLYRQSFNVITGIPGCGKSTLGNQLAYNMAKVHSWRTCYAPFEQHPGRHLRRALRHLYVGCPPTEWRPELVEAADDWIDRHFVVTWPKGDLTDKDLTLEWWLGRVAQAVHRYAVDMVILDPWNELEHIRERDESLTEYVGRAIREMKRFATYHNVAMVVIAHPTKLKTGDECSLYSISDSAHWANKCDVGMVMARNPSELTVKKIRFEDIVGHPGKVKWEWNAYCNRFDDTY